MNRRNFFRALSALAALPLIPKFLKGKTPDYPPEALTHLYAWDIDRYDQHSNWITGDAEGGPWSTPVAYAFEGPETMEWGGDVGLKPTHIYTMQDGDIRERCYYAEDWGFVQHTREKRENGIYVIEGVVLGANTRDKKWETIEA